jgi:diguanylate cyclase (GGDEF)-like protein/PAS domain S-box-containing protein
MVGLKAVLPLLRSVRTRVTLSTLACFLVSLWALSFYVTQVMRESLQKQAMDQQSSIARLVANELNDQIEERKHSLQLVATELGEGRLDDASRLQRFLVQHPVFQSQFNGGVFITDGRGQTLASQPESAQRVGVSYQDRDYFQRALRSNQPVVAEPLIGRRLNMPVIAMATAIRNTKGVALGVLVGVVNLGASSFLDQIMKNHYGETGGYLLVSRVSRMVVMATDKVRVMTLAAKPGISPLIDHFMAGGEGAGLTVNGLGQSVLMSAKGMAAVDWYVAVSMPTQEAFALVNSVQMHMALATLLLSAVAGFLTWHLLRRQLRPLLSASSSLAQQNRADVPTRELPVESDDEIGDLIQGFNALLATLKERETELRIAAAAFESQEGIFVANADWVILKVNRAFTQLTGYSPEEALGQLPQTLLGSNRQDEAFYAAMTASLETQGSWQGEVWDRRKDGVVFPVWLILTALRDGQGAVTHYVVTMMDITDRKAAEDEIRNLAFYDPLTGLPNRRLLMDRLGRALTHSARHKRKGALLFLDLDNFKDLNDTLGHDKGDQLLKQVALRLLTCVREGDTVARLGGDEFVVMLQELSDDGYAAVTQAEDVADKVLEVLNQPYMLTDAGYRSTPSIGITLFGDKHEPLDELLKRADLAMYQAKAAGRNTLRFFDAHMQTAVSHRASLEAALHEAVAQAQFVLHYQVQVDAQDHIIGTEALVRWRHPLRGMVSPAEFIPLAEDTGIIVPLGRWILESACRQIAAWASHPRLQQLTVSVNISARQLMRSDFVDSVLAVLATTGADPKRLKLELTESVLVSDVDNTIAKMHALRAHGIGFSMDDFGTGYSSLSFLKLLPLDQLKIDQGFVRDILVDSNDAAIAKMVIALADSLNLHVIAEGVENMAQREFLAAQGCFAYQGYLFGRPMDLAALESSVLHRATAVAG